MTALLVSIACIVSNLLISTNASFKMDELENMVITVVPEDNLGDSIALDDDKLNGKILEAINNSKERFWTGTISETLIIVLISSIITYIMVGICVKPLEKFNRKLEDINEKNLSDEIEVDTDIVEIERLRCSFNKMLSRLDEAFKVQKRFSASAAHEMKTPLALVKTRVDILKKSNEFKEQDYKELLDLLDSQSSRLSSVIDVLLQMVDLNHIEQKEEIYLADLLEELSCDLDTMADMKGVSLSYTCEDIKLRGNYALIYRAVYNLIENAIKYNKKDGTVEVEVIKQAGTVDILVKDTCTKIPREYADKIFEPFFRVDKSRSREMGGAGLGLALVKEIAIRHNGEVALLDSRKEGNIIRISFPRI